MNNLFAVVAMGFVATFITTFILAQIAKTIGYIDTAGGHKSHDTVAMPVGGVAIFLVVVIGTWISLQSVEDSYFLIAVALLVVSGAVDEHLKLGVLPRIVIEFGASLVMAFGAGIVLTHFGNLFGFGTLYLAFPVGLLFTAIAVFGTINAWNMIDGIDGLSASMAILSLASFLYVTAGHENLPSSVYLIFGGLFAFLCFNFSSGQGFLPKVFLGDAGSKLIGFCLVWFMIRDTQGDGLDFKPATALFVMGLPIMDMTTTVLNRIQRRVSPFSPDRTHIHHVLMACNKSAIQTYWLVVLIASMLHLVGLLLHTYQVAGYIQFGIYIVLFLVYHGVVSRVKKRTFKLSELSQGAS